MSKPLRSSSQDDNVGRSSVRKQRTKKPPPVKKRQHRINQPSSESLPAEHSPKMGEPIPAKRSISVPKEKKYQRQKRSSSENDVLPPSKPVNALMTMMEADDECVGDDSKEAEVQSDKFEQSLFQELQVEFGEDVALLLSNILCDLELYSKSSIAQTPKHVVLLSAASNGFKLANLGKLKKWLEEVSAHIDVERSSCQGRQLRSDNSSSSSRVVPQRHTYAGGSLDSVLAREGHTRTAIHMVEEDDDNEDDNKKNVKFDGGNSGGGSASAGKATLITRSSTLVKLVQKRFRAEFASEIIGILGDCMVEHEDDLAYVGETVLDTAIASGRLTVIQINKLSDWIDAVKEKRKGKKDRKVNQRADDQALTARLGEAISIAVSSPNPSDVERAKSSAALAMLEISEKKRHFKGLRADDADDYIGTRF
jgi:hypothetical protein